MQQQNGGRGRPRGHVTKQRTADFLQLIATGHRPDEAARKAGVDAGRALRIVSEPDFHAVVAALKTGLIGPTVVELAPDAQASRAVA